MNSHKTIIDQALRTLEQLDAGALVSICLPGARRAFELAGKTQLVHWVDCETYGLGRVPFAGPKPKDRDEQLGRLMSIALRSARGPKGVTMAAAERAWQKGYDRPAEDDSVLPQSVSELERITRQFDSETLPQLLQNGPAISNAGRDAELQLRHMNSERLRVLDAIRNALYQRLYETLGEAEAEKENVELLGADYRLVIQYLDALESPVGHELTSALNLIKSKNTADWAAAALQCRNVVLALGRLLFQSSQDEYNSQLTGRTLNLAGEREKNKLHAYIDTKWQESEGNRETFERIGRLVEEVYAEGSGGKAGIRKSKAQSILVSTFELVFLLNECTDLEAITIDATSSIAGRTPSPATGSLSD